MITFYWDNEYDNQWEPGVLENQRPELLRWPLWSKYLQGAVHKVTKKYKTPGVWYVNMDGLLSNCISCWEDDRELFGKAIPKHVKQGMRDGKLVLLVDNSAEGKDLNFDEIYTLQMCMKNQNLPAGSVVFVTGCVNADNVYAQKVREMHESGFTEVGDPMVHFLYLKCLESMDLTDLDEDITELPVLEACADPDSKDFLSLNQTIKQHRMEHVYHLIKHSLHEHGLINASWIREGVRQCTQYRNEPEKDLRFIHNEKNYHMLIHTDIVLPLTADHDFTKQHPDHLDGGKSKDGYYTKDLFTRTLLSFVTESEFVQQRGLFVSEKTYKVLLAGHPFIVLAPQGTLAYLESEGFHTNLCNIDTTYDKLVTDRDRFAGAHRSLENWINIPREEKINLIKRDAWKLRHNRELCHRYMCLKGAEEVAVPLSHSEVLEGSAWRNFRTIQYFLENLLTSME